MHATMSTNVASLYDRVAVNEACFAIILNLLYDLWNIDI